MKILQFYFTVVIALTCLYACNNENRKKTVEKDKLTGIHPDSVKLEIVTTAIDVPVQMNVAPDNTHRRFITDHEGKIWILKNDSLLSKPFLDISVKPLKKDQASALGKIAGVAFHPQFANNGKFYVCYTAVTSVNGNQCKLAVSEFTVSNNNADAADIKSEHRVFELEGKNIGNNGSEIAFGPDGYLYISVGDDNLGDSNYTYHAQDLNFFNGKLLRIDVNKVPYGIPADNPFVAVKNAKPEIWAYGFRKMWRFTFDPVSHELLGADVGQEKQEEIDVITKGANYGWPAMEGDSVFEENKSTRQAIYTAPVNAYTHKDGLCIIGGSFYYGKSIPSLQNKYVFADFNGNMFTLTKNQQGQWVRQPLKILNKPTDPFLICGCNTDENNELYVMGFLNMKEGSKGVVYKIVKG